MKTRYFAVSSVAIAVLTLLLGVLLSLSLGNWGWLSRSGSLVVVNGIILTSHQIIDHINRLKQHQSSRPLQFGRDWAGAEKRQLIHVLEGSVWQSEKYGLYMLIFGTLVWGFGDLLNLL